VRPETTAYAPIIAPASGLRWARRGRRSRGTPIPPAGLHIADRAGNLLCDERPGVTRGVEEPLLASEIHPECLRVYRFRHDPERLKR
jgi:hypothetical protein